MPPSTGFDNLIFDAREDLDVGAGGLGQAAIGDLDGDGLVDVAVVSWTALSVAVERGNPDGSFSLLPPLATPSSPLALAAGDVSGDGRADLAVACTKNAGTGIPSVTVFEQDSAGGFSQGYGFALACDPTSVVVGSVDGVHQDIFVTQEEDRSVWQLRVDAPQTISLVARIDSTSIGDGAPVTVALLDELGDGDLDLAVGERQVTGGLSDRVVLHANDGSGAFTTPPQVLLPGASWPAVQAVDADGDAYPDLAVAQLSGSQVVLLLGSASGFASPGLIDFGSGQFSVAFGDFDGDGTIDVAAPLYQQGAVAVRLQKVPGAYDAPSYFNVGNGARTLAASLLPGDNRVDLICSNFESVSLLRNTGIDGFASMRGFPVGDRPQYVRCADFDADGHPDAVSVDQYQRTVVFQRGLGDGTFEYVAGVPLSPSGEETPGYLIVADFDEDGLPDALASVLEDAAVQLMRNDGTLPLSSLLVDRIPVGSLPRGLAAGYLDDDTHLDFVVANSGDRTLQVVLGNGDGTFEPQLPIALADQPLTLYCQDLDGDELVDVALAAGELDGSGARLVTWRGDGRGHLAQIDSIELDSTALVMNGGDFDGDGALDLTLSQFGYPQDDVYVLLNRGKFAFEIQKILVGNNPGTLEVADVNQDGNDDLLAPLGIGRLRVLLGDGQGGFQTSYPDFAVDLPSPFATNASAWCDLNADALPDLLLIAPESVHMWVSLNHSY